jgi:phosphoglycerate dehydrogenase-like enzyme
MALSKWRVLFATEQFAACAAAVKARLPADRFEVLASPDDALLSQILDAHVVVPCMTRVTQEVIEAGPNLRLIHQWGVGLEGVDVATATQCNVPVCNIPAEGSGNDFSVAEHALFLLLSILRDANGLQREFANGILGAPLGGTLFGRHVCILGYGSIAKKLAPALRALNCEVTAIRRGGWTDEEAAEVDHAVSIANGGRDALHSTLKECVQQADALILCCPQTAETVGIVDEAILSDHKGLYLVNVARGGLIDYDALLQAMEHGTVAGLGLDVFWSEPFDPRDPLVDRNRFNVVCTGHVGGHSTTANAQMGDLLCQNILALQSAEDQAGASDGGRTTEGILNLQNCANKEELLMTTKR